MKILGKNKRDESIMVNMFRSDYKNCLLVRDEVRKINISNEYGLDEHETGRIKTFFDLIDNKKIMENYEKVCIDDAEMLLGCIISKNNKIISITM